MKKMTLILCFLTLSMNLFSQTKVEKVTKEDLSQKTHPIDSTASAAVLFERGDLKLDFDTGWKYSLDVFKRVKIYNQDSYDEANIEISFYTGKSTADQESISHLKAKIYNLENGKIVETKVSKSEIFEEEVSDVVSSIKFTFPKVEDGSIIEYSYRYNSPHISSLPIWSFQEGIPVDFSEVTYTFPDKYLNYKPNIRGFHDIETHEENKSGKIKVRSSQGVRSSSRATLETGIKTITHRTKNLPKISGEAYVNNINNYLTSVKYELLAYREFGLAAHRKFFNTNWQDVAKAVNQSRNFGDQLAKESYYKNDLVKVLVQSPTDLDKMNNIFDYVKSRMVWNKNNRLFTSQNIQKSYKEKVGNSADINLMLTSMMKHAGLNAYTVLSSTINNGIPYSPTITGLNYVTCMVKIGNETFLLDATSKYSKPNLLPRRVLNWSGIVITDNDMISEIDLMPTSVSRITTMVGGDLSAEGIVSGKVRRAYYDYFALNYRSSNAEKSTEQQIESLENSYEDTEILNLSNTNLEDLSKPAMLSFDFKTSSKYVDIIGGKLYISPMLFLALEENPFKIKERNYPIDFTYPRESKVMLNLNIPEGFVVDYVPEKVNIALPENAGSFTYMATASDGKIQLHVNTNINANILPANFYQSLKEFFQTIVEKENEKIVLKKA